MLPGMIRRVKLHRDGDGQFIDIPRDFEFPGEDVIIRKEGDKLVIEPAPQKKPSLEEFSDIKDMPLKPAAF
jgi:antitoxin VapB